MIIADHIICNAGDKKILDDLSCKIRPRELTVLLGPNGAGKSTLLRILSGEKKPQCGKVLWKDRSIHVIPPRELATRRAMLTQQYAMSLPFTVEEVVQMGRYPHVRSGLAATDRQIVSFCLQQMQAAHLQGRLFNTLSGGEQQRVQMARVLAQLEEVPDGAAEADGGLASGREKILLLDEPTSSMDWRHQQLTLGKAKEMAVKGHTVIVVLHDLNLAAQYADRLILLKQGRLLAAGRPGDILEPALIAEAYGIHVSVLYPEECDFPVVVPIPVNTKTVNYQ